MTRPRVRRLLLALVALALTAAALSGVAGGSASRRIPQTNCFWSYEAAPKLKIGGNFGFPDYGAIYWGAQITMPAGSRIVFTGRFAHARYQSLNTYDVTDAAPVDALDDIHTRPNPGSTNPFRVGADRDATRRAYTITMLDTPAPTADRPPNTLYGGVAGQTGQDLIYRVYLPDAFTRADLTGGVGLPAVVLHLADGTVQTGLTVCHTLHAKTGRLPLTTAPKTLYDSLRDQPGKPKTFPAHRTPVFGAYYNTGFSIQCAYFGKCSGHPQRIGGQYSNIDNQYIAALVNRGFAAGPVLVLHGRLPATPETGPDVTRMGSGQLRYWSMCQNESLYTTRGAGCVYDSEVPIDKRRNYTIVTSLARDRPDNAVTRCGVAWIPWPTRGDGDGHLDDGTLIVRNMLPSPSFHHAIQDTRVPGDERSVLGPYYPRGAYTTRAAFQRRGCRRGEHLESAAAPARAPLPACHETHWVGSFANSPSDASAGTDASLHSLSFGSDQTFRMIVAPHLAGQTVRLRLSNRFGSAPVTFSAVTIADRGTRAGLVGRSLRSVSFSGHRSVTVAAGRDVLSDPLRFRVTPFRDVAVSIFVAGADAAPTEHFAARQTSSLTAPLAGDHVGDLSGAAFIQPTTAGYYLDGLDVKAPAREGAVVTFGDSITDGYQAPPAHLPEVQATVGINRRYPDDLQRRLDHAGIPLSVLNAGISGNRLLRGGYIPMFGPSGLSRLARDALSLPGVGDVIVLEGINDVGLTSGLTAAQLIAGYERLITAVHRAGDAIQLGTLTPASTYDQYGYGTPAGDALRDRVNRWIRHQHRSDGIVDFDAAVRDPRDPSRIAPRYDGGDGLHFDPAGYQAMANAIDLSGLARPRCDAASRAR